MENKKNVPAIRFKGFAEEWKEQKLGDKDITTSYSGGTPSVGIKEYYNGSIPFIRSGEINSNHTELFITDSGLNNSSARMVEVGDILYALYGATSGEVGISQINGAINQAIMVIKPKSGYKSYFIAYWLRKEKSNIIRTYLQGGQGNLSSSIVKGLKVDFPVDTNEQQAIGNYFQNIDRLINTSQTKLDKLKNIKKACLEKMFTRNSSNTPELRFNGFTEGWKEIAIEDIASDFYGGGTPRTSIERYWNGNIPWIQTSDLKEDVVFGVVPQKYISNSGVKESATKLVPENSIAVITRVGVGKLALIPFRYATSQDFLSISKLKVDEYFAAYIMHQKMQTVLKEVQGTSIKGVTKEELLAKKIEIPTKKDEQKAIGRFFKNLDDLIAKTELQINKLKNIKKACLNKMFVNRED